MIPTLVLAVLDHPTPDQTICDSTISLGHRPISGGNRYARIARESRIKVDRQRPKQWHTKLFRLIRDATMPEDMRLMPAFWADIG